MRELTNLTNTIYDLERYKDGEDVRAFLRGAELDGLEILPYGSYDLGVIPRDTVFGVHMSYHACWVDYWQGNREDMLREFGDEQTALAHFGGDRQAIVRRFREQLAWAQELGAEYVVFHVGDVSLAETVTYRFRHTNRQVMDAAMEWINAILDGGKYDFAFLMENLWWPGLTLMEPEETKRLLDGVEYKNKGIMLDTGHLMHTSLSVKTERQGIAYIREMLEKQGKLRKWLRGCHLHQSATGGFVERMIASPPLLHGSYREKLGQAYEYVLGIDRHQPFSDAEIGSVVRDLPLEWLTHEFITCDRAEHERFLQVQRSALKGE